MNNFKTNQKNIYYDIDSEFLIEEYIANLIIDT